MNLKLSETTNENDARTLKLRERLTEFNDPRFGKADRKNFGFFFEADSNANSESKSDSDSHPHSKNSATGEIAAGVWGWTHYGWAYVAMLWVADSHQGQGLGKKLLAQVEKVALERGAHHAYIDTFCPIAKRFYESQGYSLYGTLGDFPPGHSRFFLKKDLSA